jgi:hypothetical protein
MKAPWRSPGSGPLGERSFRLLAGALVGVAVLGGLTQREFRLFGAAAEGARVPAVGDDAQAAEGSRK